MLKNKYLLSKKNDFEFIDIMMYLHNMEVHKISWAYSLARIIKNK